MHSWQGRGGDLDYDGDGNNDHKDDNSNDGERGHNEDPKVKDNGEDNATSFLTQQPTCGRMHSW